MGKSCKDIIFNGFGKPQPGCKKQNPHIAGFGSFVSGLSLFYRNRFGKVAGLIYITSS